MAVPLLLLGASLDQGKRAANLHDSLYDRELGAAASALPASKLSGRSASTLLPPITRNQEVERRALGPISNWFTCALCSTARFLIP